MACGLTACGLTASVICCPTAVMSPHRIANERGSCSNQQQPTCTVTPLSHPATASRGVYKKRAKPRNLWFYSVLTGVCTCPRAAQCGHLCLLRNPISLDRLPEMCVVMPRGVMVEGQWSRGVINRAYCLHAFPELAPELHWSLVPTAESWKRLLLEVGVMMPMLSC